MTEKPEWLERATKLQAEAASLTLKLSVRNEFITSLTELTKKGDRMKDPHLGKAVVGQLRDVACDMIAMGANLRRQCDLMEPMMDDEIKEEEGAP